MISLFLTMDPSVLQLSLNYFNGISLVGTTLGKDEIIVITQGWVSYLGSRSRNWELSFL